ncbi:hypothetical protein [Thiorhodococcus minor]|uniref:Uncharacterized protein n=1 Tax=Thiorhodococcus minor TaxID=57489 RepID=A0A6M0K9U4_9GAMM|nr:hypothetical protein [Thiorhodococcus minor]NEV65335.1 hypothetical protein [Thiorhodococcus minor]
MASLTITGKIHLLSLMLFLFLGILGIQYYVFSELFVPRFLDYFGKNLPDGSVAKMRAQLEVLFSALLMWPMFLIGSLSTALYLLIKKRKEAEE